MARAHLEDCDDFLDLFRTSKFKSTERTRVFLWLCFHYLESPTEPNPYADQHARDNPGKAPRMEDHEGPVPGENIDPPDEVSWGIMKMEKRRAFLEKGKLDEARSTPAADEPGASTSAIAGPSTKEPAAPRAKAKGGSKKRQQLNLDAIIEQIPSAVDASVGGETIVSRLFFSHQ